jgi:hypothetical protein
MNYNELALVLWNTHKTVQPLEMQINHCFYAALNATNHYAYANSIHSTVAPRSHKIHQQNLAARDFAFMIEYEELRTLSEQARYCPMLYPMSNEKIEMAEKLASVILRSLQLIE